MRLVRPQPPGRPTHGWFKAQSVCSMSPVEAGPPGAETPGEPLGRTCPHGVVASPLCNSIRCLLEILLCPDHEHFLCLHDRQQGGVGSAQPSLERFKGVNRHVDRTIENCSDSEHLRLYRVELLGGSRRPPASRDKRSRSGDLLMRK
jgi:hypothetical protein